MIHSVKLFGYTDQDRHSVSPDLGPNSFKRFPADEKSTGYFLWWVQIARKGKTGSNYSYIFILKW